MAGGTGAEHARAMGVEALGPWPLRVAGIHAEYSPDLRTWADCPSEWVDYPLDGQAVEIAPPADAPRFFLRLMIDP